MSSALGRLAKGVKSGYGEIRRKALLRAEVSAFFPRRLPGVVAMQACGSAHHWGRVPPGLGHEVRLLEQPIEGHGESSRNRRRYSVGKRQFPHHWQLGTR